MSKEDISDIVKTLIEFKGDMNTALEHIRGEVELSRIETITEVQGLEIKLSGSIADNTKSIALVRKGQSSQGREINEIKKRCENVQTSKHKKISIIPKKHTMLDEIKGYGALIIGVLTIIGGVVVALLTIFKK